MKITYPNLKLLLLIIFTCLIFNIACDNFNKCGECFTPPSEINLRILSSSDSCDLIETGFYNPDSVSVFYIENNTRKKIAIEIYTDTITGKSVLFLSDISWKSAAGTKEFYLRLSSVDTDTIFLDVRKMHNDCCTYYNQKAFRINNQNIESDYTNYSFFYLKKSTS